MPISVDCQCGKKITTKSANAGKRVKCPSCGESVRLPGKKQSPADAKDKANPQAKVPAQCQCGARFSAKAKYAGKKVACPKCSQPVRVPSPTAAAKTDQPRQETKPRSKPQKAPDTLGQLFEDVGLGVGVSPHLCPKCKQDIAADSVICIKCGFDIESGRQLHTKSWVRDESAIGNKPISHVAGILAKMPDQVRKLYRSLTRLSLFYMFAVLALGAIIIYQQTIPDAKTLLSAGVLAGLIALAVALGGACYFASRLVLQHSRLGLSLGLVLSILSLPVIPFGPLGVMAAVSGEAKRYFR